MNEIRVIHTNFLLKIIKELKPLSSCGKCKLAHRTLPHQGILSKIKLDLLDH